MNHHILSVLQVDPVCIRAVTRRRNRHIENLNAIAIVKLEVKLWAVYNCYACDCNFGTSIKPECLQHTYYFHHSCLKAVKRNRGGFWEVVLTVGLVLGIFPLLSLVLCYIWLSWEAWINPHILGLGLGLRQYIINWIISWSFIDIQVTEGSSSL